MSLAHLLSFTEDIANTEARREGFSRDFAFSGYLVGVSLTIECALMLGLETSL